MIYAIITHSDIDGIASTALYLYLMNNPNYKVFFTEPFRLHETLRNRVIGEYYNRVVITDLGINPEHYHKVRETLSLLRKQKIDITWYDHHIWERKWITDIIDLGIELYVDTSTCATGVVAKYTKSTRLHVDKNYVEELVNGVCAGDLWKFNHWLSPYYMRLIRRSDSDSWRKRVLKTLSNGIYWNQEFESKVIEQVERELDVFSSNIDTVMRKHNDQVVLIAENDNHVDNSFLAAYLMGRYNVDLVVITDVMGKLSFRSRVINVRDLAKLLGGGGHLYAAGAKIELPSWIKLLSRLNKKILLHYVADIVVEKLRELVTSYDHASTTYLG